MDYWTGVLEYWSTGVPEYRRGVVNGSLRVRTLRTIAMLDRRRGSSGGTSMRLAMVYSTRLLSDYYCRFFSFTS